MVIPMFGDDAGEDNKQSRIQTFMGGEVQRLLISKGDRFVILFKEKLPSEAHERIKSIWREFTDDPEAKLLILDGGAQLGVFHADKVKEE